MKPNTPLCPNHSRLRLTLGVAGLLLAALAGAALPARATDGDVETGFDPNANSGVYCSVLQPDGKILLGGFFTSVGGTTRNYIARVNADGTLDTSFNPNANNYVMNLAVQADGRIIMGGRFTSVGGVARNYIARLNPDGTLDTSFNPNANGEVYCVSLQTDGKILLGGAFGTVGGTTRYFAARLNADGTLDTGFNPNPGNPVWSIPVQADGKILLGGGFQIVGGTARRSIARLNADGTLDASFNPNANGVVESVLVQPDGKILLGGLFTTVGGTVRNYIARLNANGSLDTSFNPNVNNGAYGYAVYGMSVQADGKILLVGYFTTVGGTARNRIARVNADGTLDTSFNPNPNSDVIGVSVQADGKILLGGYFTTVGGTARNHIARLLNGPATQTLGAPDATQVQWLRGGTAPEVAQVTFELSVNGGASWTALGNGTRITGGWTKTGLSLPGNGLLRARGRASGGTYNGSSSLIEQVQAYYTDTTPPSITCPANVAVNANSGLCYATGVALGTPTASDDFGSVTVTSNAPAQFPVGVTPVTWTATDSSGNTNTCTQLVTVTAPAPVPAADTLSTRVNTLAVVPEFKLLANDTHPLGRAMHLAGVTASGLGSMAVLGSTNGETVALYTPPANFTGSDTFTYTNADSCGMTAVGTVNVTVTASGSFFNLVSIHSEQVAADTVVRIVVMGIPSVSYTLQRAESLAASTPWSDLLSRPAGTTGSNFGRVVFLVTNPPSPTYYRTKTP